MCARWRIEPAHKLKIPKPGQKISRKNQRWYQLLAANGNTPI
jgi:hypothetical protein